MQDVFEAFESLYRGSTFEVKCLVKVPVVEEQFVLVLSHVKRRSTCTVKAAEFLTPLRPLIFVLTVWRQENTLAAVAGHVHLDEQSDEALIGWHIDLLFIVEVGHSIGQMLDICEVNLNVVLGIDVARPFDNLRKILSLLKLQRARLFIPEQGVTEYAEFEQASAE